MTNINCTKKCCYQEDGKCCYDSVTASKISLSVNSQCPYQSEDNEIIIMREDTQL